MSKIEEIRARAEKASKGPWTTCHEGKCRCKQVWCADDHPVAVIECGKTGDDYPVIEDGKAVMKQETYWDISEETGEANANFTAHAREDIPYLLTALAEKGKRIEELEAVVDDLVEAREFVCIGDYDSYENNEPEWEENKTPTERFDRLIAALGKEGS